MGSGALPDAVEALQRTGEERRVLAGARICFQWAPGEWYLGTVTGATSTPAWWRLSWDLGSSNQVLLGDANRNKWFVVRDARDNKMLEGMLREQQLADEEVPRLLILADLPQRHSSRTVAMRLLHAAGWKTPRPRCMRGALPPLLFLTVCFVLPILVLNFEAN